MKKDKAVIILKIFAMGLIMVAATFLMQKAVGNTILVALGVMQPEKGPPETFFLVSIGILGFLSGCTYAIAYLLIGKKIPVKNNVLRAMTFGLLIYFSNYLAQSLGLLGATGADVIMTFQWDHAVFDFFGYLITFAICGVLFKTEVSSEPFNISKKTFFVTTALSAVVFPALMLAITQLTALIISSENMAIILNLENGTEFGFYLTFYLCFILTGGLLPSFYFLTAYRLEKPKKHITFALIYSLLIWTPIVLAMIAFGVNILSMIIFAIESIIVFIVLMVLLQMVVKRSQCKK